MVLASSQTLTMLFESFRVTEGLQASARKALENQKESV
jgi:hypothetical protein